MPDKLKEMQALFLTEAAKYQVLPLDNSGFARLLTPRPSAVAGKTVFTYTGENAGIPVGNAPSILDKDYTITADVTIPKGGAEGMIVTLGGRFGGVARVGGMGLLTLGVACWLARDDARSRAAKGLVAAMVLYNLGVALILGAAGIRAHLIGLALWPAVTLHAVMAVWCIVSLLSLKAGEEPRSAAG